MGSAAISILHCVRTTANAFVHVEMPTEFGIEEAVSQEGIKPGCPNIRSGLAPEAQSP